MCTNLSHDHFLIEIQYWTRAVYVRFKNQGEQSLDITNIIHTVSTKICLFVIWCLSMVSLPSASTAMVAMVALIPLKQPWQI